MITRVFFLSLLITISLIPLGCHTVEKAEVQADIIMKNAVIYTVDDAFSVVDAMAVKDGRILAAGKQSDIMAFAGKGTSIIDLDGATVLPGLIDAHAHLVGYAVNLDRLDVGGQETLSAVLDLVKDRAANLEPGEWIVGRGWDQNDWNDHQGFPAASDLDAAAPDNPVVLTRVDGHANWANSAAMEIAGITSGTEAPSGGEIIRNQAGTPTGVFIDAAEELINAHVPRPSDRRVRELMSQALEDMHAVGITGSHEMGGSSRITAMVRDMIAGREFDYRLVMYYSSGNEDLEEKLAEEERVIGNHNLIIAGIKAYADGALGSRGAAMLEPYDDRPDTRGLIITERERISELTSLALDNGRQIATHAIGDRANRMVLDAYEAALEERNNVDHRSRVEHAQIVSPEDLPRFSQLGVIPSMQPTHCTSDYPWALDRIGEERAEGAYAWRTLLDYGNYIPCGSDFPVEDINPFYGIEAAITRARPGVDGAKAYFASERMTREEALRGFTIWAARAAFMEDVLGSLEAGKYADFIVINQDIMTISNEADIHSTEVLRTYIEGELIFEAGK